MTKWQPTQEQIEAVANTILTVQRSCTGHQNDVGRAWSSARAAISVLAPMIAKHIAEMAADFGWILPVLKTRELNNATDDAACAVMQQFADAIRSRFNLPAKT